MKKKEIYTALAILVAAVGLIIWGSTENRTQAGVWPDTAVACLPQGHQSAVRHIHAELSITVDGQTEPIPANIGVSPACMAEVHTHDASGEIHVETTNSDRTITLGDFFAVWDKSFARDGHAMEVRVNGEVAADPAGVVLEDHRDIELIYSSEEPQN